MSYFVKIILLFLIYCRPVWGSGGIVGNGGGFASCTQSPKGLNSGSNVFYSYDFLVRDKSRGLEILEPQREVADVKADLLFIIQQLERLQDPIGRELRAFASTMFTQEIGQKYKWFKVNDLPLMWEPELDELLPLKCRTRIQAVYFFPPSQEVPYSAYQYDPKVIDKVLSQPGGGLQVSYLWVHEWLWNYFPREKYAKVAAFNQLLHNKNLSDLESTEYYKVRPDQK